MNTNTVHTYGYPGAETAADIAIALVGSVANIPARVFQVLTVWQKRYEQRLHLDTMSDHLIKDMGLSRSDVNHEVVKQFWEA
jgi:uncharacterized protein YjiS (DUF1127 family)